MIIKGVNIRKIYTYTGSFFVFLGIVGIFLPIFPTAPFLVLALICYSKGSKKHYNWLIRNKYFGKYIKDYQEGKGVPLHGKIMGILGLWISIIGSISFFVTNLTVKIFMVGSAIVVTIYLIKLKTKK